LESDIGKVIKTAGGGARSRIWLDILSMVLGIEIHAHEMTWEATAAADIAARLAWPTLSPTRASYVAEKHRDSYQPLLDDNLRRIKEKYHELEWL
jgi:sugar (pentulose or hexulose) kinase